jgi:Domain of unknown function (DUF4430)
MAISITVEDGPTLSVSWKTGMNAQDAIEAAQQQAGTSAFTFALQYYGPALGYLVLMINETYDSYISSAAPFFYWEFLVNGQPSPSGIDSTKLNDGDAMTFRFTVYNATTHASTPLSAKHKLRTSNSTLR